MLRADPAFVPFDIVLFDPPYEAAGDNYWYILVVMRI